jgi:sugar (pentulose or hexulose) kinase
MYLGIDIGTTTTSAAVIDAGGDVRASASQTHGADLPGPQGYDEQDPARLLESAWATVRSLSSGLRAAIRAVGVTGQMHGVLLLGADGRPVTPLITWRDGRCLQEAGFLPALNERTGYALRTGHGCATAAWLASEGRLPQDAASASTIQDLAVMLLCGEKRPATDPTDAASWGLFDLATLDWDRAAVEAAGIPPALLPPVRPCGSRAGSLCASSAEELGVPPGIPVCTAIGDNQASLLATLGDPAADLALTLGTGGQASAVMPAGVRAQPVPTGASFEYRPYPGGRFAVVASALCGGAAWAWLVDSVNGMLEELGLPPMDRDKLFARINELGLSAAERLPVIPSFLGERHDAELRGSIGGLGVRNFGLGPLAAGLAYGILRNLRDMLPDEALQGRKRLVGSGNALRRVPLLRQAAEGVFDLPLVLITSLEEASAGAALLARHALECGDG